MIDKFNDLYRDYLIQNKVLHEELAQKTDYAKQIHDLDKKIAKTILMFDK